MRSPRPLPPRGIALAILLTASCAAALPASAQEVEDPPKVLLRGVPFQLTLQGGTAADAWEVRDAGGRVLASGVVEPGGSATAADLRVDNGSQLPLEVRIGETVESLRPTLTSGWFALLPPLLAIVLALVFREVITALVAGVWLGALAVAGFNPLTGTWRMIDGFLAPALADGSHASIVIFSLLLGGMVGIIARNGGTMGVVERLTPLARSPRRGKLATATAGIGVFFDDYANCLIVGNTMRPITDRLRISREKLAYLVDTSYPCSLWLPAGGSKEVHS